MLGMVVHAETSAQSIALFIRGTHGTGNFIELLAQYRHRACGHLSELNSRQRRMQFIHTLDHWALHKIGQTNISPKSRDAKQSRHPTCINRPTVQTGSTYAAWDSLKCALRPFTSAFAWRNAYADVCHKWTLFLSYCLSHQV